MTDVQVLAFTIVPLAGVALAWGVTWFTGRLDARDARHTPAE